MFDGLRKQIADRIYSQQKNSMSLPQQFLKYGNKGNMVPNWTKVSMSDKDFYTGYSYAAIRNRANAAAKIALEGYVNTFGADNSDDIHPYLKLIDTSPTFTTYQFWNEISTYLDLEGVYYLMAIRAYDENSGRYGNVTEFKLLNPYNIRRVFQRNNVDLQGYIEVRGGLTREIAKELIIPIYELNPFDETKPYAMTDAAKESQFTLLTADDYTRHTLRNNINTPGIIGTDVILDDANFANFAARIKNHTKGEPIFSNGSAVKWEPMQTNLKDAGLKDVNEVSRDVLFAVSGVSKTMMGIEQSGVTRETSKVQKDLMIEGQVLPRLQLVADALNQDYKNTTKRFVNGAKDLLIVVSSPVSSDYDGKLKEREVKMKDYEMYKQLLNDGYTADIARKYVDGDIDLESLGEPTNKPIVPTSDSTQDGQQTNFTNETEEDIVVENANTQSNIIAQSSASLQNAIVNVDAQLSLAALDSVKKRYGKRAKNAIEDDENLVISESQKNESIGELVGVLASFYGIVLTVEGVNAMRKRVTELKRQGLFSVNRKMLNDFKSLAMDVAVSHVNTVSNDLYETVRQAALEGLSRDQLIDRITTQYAQNISEQRAKTVARTETNRAFTLTQYEADKQFVEQNNIRGRVYKQWVTRSDNPCEFCIALSKEEPILLDTNFRDLGSSVEVDGKVLNVGFTELSAGNAHPNCACAYELIIKDEPANNSADIEKEKLAHDIHSAIDRINNVL